MERKESILQQKLDHDVNNFRLDFLRVNFFDGNKLSATGRFYMNSLMVLLSLIYFISDNEIYTSLCLLSVLSLIMPLLINLTTNTIIKKMKLKPNNLYDMMAAIGSYVLVLIPACAACFIIVHKLSKMYPDAFGTILSIPGAIILVGGFFLIRDYRLMNKQNGKSFRFRLPQNRKKRNQTEK